MNGATAIRFVIAALAVWRLSFLLARENGPGNSIARLRSLAQNSAAEPALGCVKCVGVWLAIPFAGYVGGDWLDMTIIAVALAGVTALIDEWIRPPFEWRETTGERDELLRSTAEGRND